MQSADVLATGTDVEISITEAASGLNSKGVVRGPRSRRAEVVSRKPRSWREGEIVSGWIAEANPTEEFYVVYVDDFGRLPISDRMRPRYLAAVTHALKSQDIIELDEVHRAELQGMFNRVRRRDQWDWFSVAEVLGKPTRELCWVFVAYLTALKEARKQGSEPPRLSVADADDLRGRLKHASSALSIPPGMLSRTRPSTPKRLSSKSSDDPQRQVLSSYALDKLQSANREHARTLDLLKAYFSKLHTAFEENQSVDLFVPLKSGPAIFEVKSIHADNEQAQARAALSQLYEYRFREKLPGASLWIVFSKQPTLSWLIDYFERDRDVRVVWFEDGEIFGPSAARLNESGSRARARGQTNSGGA